MIYLKKIKLKEKEGLDRSSYPLSIPALRGFNEMTFDNPVTFLVGENGMGKSTLIEAIAIVMNFNPEGGTLNFNFSTTNSHSDLYQYLTPVRGAHRNKDGFFLRAESLYNALSYMDTLKKDIFNYYGGKRLHEVSHGESFMNTLIHRCKGNSFFIFDEPEAALSPLSQIKMLVRMHQLVEDDSQFVISTHSPILMAYPNATIYQLTQSGISKTKFDETEHYMLMKSFLNNPEKFIKELGFE